MKIIVLTQNENLYLPKSFGVICSALHSDIVGILVAPAMSTHGGLWKGFIKHFNLFGIKGTFIMGTRVLKSKLFSKISKPGQNGPFYSIKQVSDVFQIPYHYIERINGQIFQNILDKYKPELLISISCPQVIGKNIRERIPMGCINVHGSPLPKYRGLMPTFWVLKNNEQKTCATVHDLEEDLDDGDIILQREVDIAPDDTWDSLVVKTKAAGTQALINVVQQIKNKKIIERKPNRKKEATYFSFPTNEDRKIFLKMGRRFF